MSGVGSSRTAAVAWSFPAGMSIARFLLYAPLPIGVHKHSCAAELRRALPEDSWDLALPPAAAEELRRICRGVMESSARAKERATALHRSIQNLDEYQSDLVWQRVRTVLNDLNDGGSTEEEKSTTRAGTYNMPLEGFTPASAVEERPQCSSPIALSPWGELCYYLGGAVDSALRGVEEDRPQCSSPIALSPWGEPGYYQDPIALSPWGEPGYYQDPIALSPWGEPGYYQGEAVDSALWGVEEERPQCYSPIALPLWGEPGNYQYGPVDSALPGVQDDHSNDMWSLSSPTPALQPSSDLGAHGKDTSCIMEFHLDAESIIPFRSNITSRFSSGYAEASSSTHSSNYLSATEPMAMKFEELRRITDGFSEERLLGQGGFGTVYKGVLDDGEVIAIKKLNPQQGLIGESFRNEIQNLMRVQHQNIISLVGYCEETRDRVVEYEGKLVAAVEIDRAICLEYMQGGTLEKLLSDESCGLDWEARYRIIKGTCQGLQHLHTGSDNPIYHLDLNPANILLDKDQIPKIGDFGLSRLLASPATFVTKTNSGTLGYMPPEYMHGQQISSKFDVFSLGIVIIKVIAGPDGYFKYKCIYTSPKKFMDHVTQNWSKRVQARKMSAVSLQKVKKCIKMALRCVEDDRAKRPTITEIVKELNMIS